MTLQMLLLPSNTLRQAKESRRQGCLLLSMQNWQRVRLMRFLRLGTELHCCRDKHSKTLLKSSSREQSEATICDTSINMPICSFHACLCP
uniref:Uncharacterized protein n=1 Tax=Triticum urartu TaxID=4572 RepID=A0A8R7QQ18_TRIUA